MSRDKIHDLKTWIESFSAIMAGNKKAEYRLNDRNFKVGDSLNLREWNKDKEEYTGRSILVDVTHIVHGGIFGIPDGYCVMSISPVGSVGNHYETLQKIGRLLREFGVDTEAL